jgi:predicted nucleic acid-binding protein
MILADTSVWIKFLSGKESALKHLLEADQVAMHAFVVGELSLGSLKNRDEILFMMDRMHQADVVASSVVRQYIEKNELFSTGLGWIDVHLLVSCALTSNLLFTYDKQLMKQAIKHKVAYLI